jgi:hypothetical protein
MPATVNSAAEESMIFLQYIKEKSLFTSNMVKDKLQYVMLEFDSMEVQKCTEQIIEYPPYFIEMRSCLESIFIALEEIDHFINRTSL